VSAKLFPQTVSGMTAILVVAFSVGAAAQPAAPVKPVIDQYHGVAVSDPYRYMEDLDDPAVQSWMRAQNDYARAVLARIPGRHRLLSRIEELDNSAPLVHPFLLPGNQYLIGKLLPGENALKVYLRAGATGQDKLLIDPAKIKLQGAAQSKGANSIWTRLSRTTFAMWRLA